MIKKHFFVFLIFIHSINAQLDINIMNLFENESLGSNACYRIPTISLVPNGDLIAIVDERIDSCDDLRKNEDINLVIRRSVDSGLNWSPTKKLIDFPKGESASDASLIIDRLNKTVFLFFNYMNHNKIKKRYQLMVISSVDNGITWSEPLDITSQITKANWKDDFMFITSGKGIQTKDGLLLHCLVNLDNGTHVFGSKDFGKTWFLTKSPLPNADESKIIELDNKTWMVNSRVNNSGIRHSYISNNKGNSWMVYPENDLIDPGCNAGFIKLNPKKNLILLSNINHKSSRENLCLRYSENEGKSWSDPISIYKGSAAYSSIDALENGDIIILFERDNYSKISLTKLSLKSLPNLF